MAVILSKIGPFSVNHERDFRSSVGDVSGVWLANLRRPDHVRDATASSVLTWPVLGKARTHGLKVEALLAESNLRPTELLDGRARIPLAKLQRLWQVCDRHLRVPQLGLTILADSLTTGAVSWPEPLSLFEYLFRTSATVRDGIERLARYTRLLRDQFYVHLENAPDGRGLLTVELTAEDPWPLVQLHLGMALVLARRILPSPPQIDEVWLSQTGTAQDRAVLEAFFGARVYFGAPVNGFVSPAVALDALLPTADGALCQTLEWRANSMLAALPEPGNTADRVREALRRILPDGDVRADAIAKKLALSPRTLHRRLQAEGESYQGVLDQLRCELAKRDLACGRYSVREVGQRVGFASLSAFYRAFKTWTGRTPAEFQHQP